MEMVPKAYEEFVWVEEVRGSLSNRGRNRVVRVDEVSPDPVDYPLFRSVYRSSANLPEYVETSRGPNNPSGVRGFSGPCVATYVPFDIDRGDENKEPDWPKAISDASKLIISLRDRHGVDTEAVWCSLTGGRGVHIYLPTAYLGGLAPSSNVPQTVRALALSLASEAGVAIDEHIYDRNRLLRVPNSRHQFGKYCVPLLAAELLGMSEADLLALMDQPRPDVLCEVDVSSIDSLVEIRNTCQSDTVRKPHAAGPPKPVPGRRDEVLTVLEARDVQYEIRGEEVVMQCPTGEHDDSKPSFSINAGSGVFHCFGCGVRGSWAKCRQLLGELLPTQDDYEQLAAAIFSIRQKQGRSDLRREFEINKEVTEKILEYLYGEGRFYTDGQRAYFFFDADKRLVEISGEDEGFRFFLHRCGINPTETIYRWIVEALRNVAKEKGEKTEVHQLAHYDAKRFRLYLHDYGNQMYRIGADHVELADNGTDGVLFLDDPHVEPFKRVPVTASRLTETIISKINFANDVLTAGERQRVFELWFYSIFFESIMPTKPIMAFIGPKGSGKSSTLRKIGKLLFGKRYDVTPLTNDSKDFDAAVTNSPFVAFDNADRKCGWLNDRLATVATGGTIKKRELYTTNRLIEIPTHCFIGITARTPQFRRDDVADRLLIMKVERFTNFVSETKLIAEVLAHRDEIFSEVILKLQSIVRALRAEDGVDDSSVFRMADFADFAMKIARQEGWVETLRRIFGKLSHEQSEFTLEGDPIFETLSIWVPENEDREVTYKELHSELRKIAEREGIDFRDYMGNARAFARRMPNIRSNLEAFFDIKDIPRGGNRVVRTFRQKRVNDVSEGLVTDLGH